MEATIRGCLLQVDTCEAKYMKYELEGGKHIILDRRQVWIGICACDSFPALPDEPCYDLSTSTCNSLSLH